MRPYNDSKTYRCNAITKSGARCLTFVCSLGDRCRHHVGVELHPDADLPIIKKRKLGIVSAPKNEQEVIELLAHTAVLVAQDKLDHLSAQAIAACCRTALAAMKQNPAKQEGLESMSAEELTKMLNQGGSK